MPDSQDARSTAGSLNFPHLLEGDLNAPEACSEDVQEEHVSAGVFFIFKRSCLSSLPLCSAGLVKYLHITYHTCFAKSSVPDVRMWLAISMLCQLYLGLCGL